MTMEKTILIVDDSEFDRKLLVKAMEKKGGFKTIEVSSGEKCLELLRAQEVDLVLMDVLMPGVPGTQTLKSIREKFNAVQLPVIMITAKADVSDVVETLRLGANDYITKPVNFDVAISRALTHLKISEASREMARLQEVAALHAMISTYHHEINNPLTIALGGIRKVAANPGDSTALKTVQDSLWRVAEIVKKIRSVTEKQEVQYQAYAGSGKMIKVD